MTTPLFFQDVDRVAGPRLSEVLFDRGERRFNSLAELPSNVEAIDAGLMFANGHNPFVAIVGPSGWGKTHLLECVANHISQHFRIQVSIVNAIDWIDGQGTFNPSYPLLLDNVQDAMARTRTRVQLRLGMERRVRIGRPTMLAITSDRATRQHYSFLPVSRDWSLQEIGEPTRSERCTVIQKMAATEQLRISRPLLKLMAEQMKGNGNTIHGALNRLRLAGSDWTDPADFLRALGVLDPFFADNSAWDLMERICESAQAAQRQFPTIDARSLSCYAMIQTAQLPELHVARFCEVGPARARTLALSFKRSLNDSVTHQCAFEHFLELAVTSLAES